MYLEFYAEFKNVRKKKVCNRSSNHFIKSGIELTIFRFLWSDLNFYYRPSFFAHFWIQHKILNTKIHFLCPTTKFCLRARIFEPCGVISKIKVRDMNFNFWDDPKERLLIHRGRSQSISGHDGDKYCKICGICECISYIKLTLNIFLLVW